MFATKCKKLLSLVALVAFLAPVNLFAGTNGKITGVVKDKETGDPLPGVNIILEGTTMGAATNSKGEYSIINVPAGVYVVSTSMIGYGKVTKQNVRVLPDFTTRLDFDLTATSLGGEEVVVVAERPLIQKDQTMTMSVTGSEEIKNLPVRGFQSVANLGVGIVVNNARNLDGGTGNVNVRGGRSNETGVYIDGFQQNNMLTGISTTDIPNGAVEEVVVITGGFDAEYGRNQSGIISITSKSGSQKYSGYAEYVGDPGGLGIAESYGYNVVSAGVGGPIIPGDKRLRFFVSGEGKNIKDAEPSVWGHPKFNLTSGGTLYDDSGDPIAEDGVTLDTAIFTDADQDGYTDFKKGARPSRGGGIGINSDRGYSIQGKLTYDIMSSLRLDVTGNFTRTWRRSFVMNRLLNNELNLKRNVKSYNVGGTLTYSISDRSFVDFGANHYYSFRRMTNDAYGDDFSRYVGASQGITGGVDYDGYNALLDIGRGTLIHRWDFAKYVSFKTNYVNQIDKHNQVKVGADYFLHWVRFANVRNPDDPVYGINDYIGYQAITDANGDPQLVKTSGDNLDALIQDVAKPYSFSLYGQNKMEYEGLVLRYGMRYDLFNPGVKRLKDITNPTGQDDPNQPGVNPATGQLRAGTLGSEDYTSAKNDHRISPRLSVSFPVSDQTQFRMSYGKFFQQPNLENLYIGPTFLQRMSLQGGINAAASNPNLKAEKSTQYEVGIRRALSDRAAIDISAFYKDVEDLINVQSIESTPQSLSLSTNLDEAVVQGMTLSLELRRTNKVQARVSYTLSSARGTGSDNASNLNNAWANLNDTKITAPLSFDQRHTFNSNIDIRNAKGEGPEIGGRHWLEDAGVNLQLNAGSGLPYTPITLSQIAITGAASGRSIGRRNSQNQPWTFRLDLKADKTFRIRDNWSVNLYVQVLNVLDTKNVLDVYGATGKPDDDGYLESLDGRSKSDYYRQQYSVYYKDGFNWDTPRQARLGVVVNF